MKESTQENWIGEPEYKISQPKGEGKFVIKGKDKEAIDELVKDAPVIELDSLNSTIKENKLQKTNLQLKNKHLKRNQIKKMI